MSLSTDYISVSQAARMLEVSVTTIQSWVDDGKLEGIRTQLGRLVSRAAAEELLEDRNALNGMKK